jgi:NAD dependent epimerase/dehydratase
MQFLKNKNVLVTGADGFIGSHLVEHLTSLGCNVKAMCIYNSFNSWGWLDTLDVNITNNIDITLGDIRDIKSVNNACKNIDYVFHLASLIAIPHSYNSPYSYLQTNALGAMNIMESCLTNNVERVIHTSTSEVYGNLKKMPIKEDDLIFAKSPYSATKIAADQIAYSYYSSFDVPVSIVRPFNTYGPRQSNRAIIPTIITQALTNNKSIKLGALYPTRDFSYIKDTVRGFILAAKSKKSIGETINIGSGYEISIGDLYDIICKLTNVELKVKKDSTRIRPKKGEVFRLKADNKKAKKLLGWTPQYANRQGLIRGLRETIDWFKIDSNLLKYKSDRYTT